MISSREKLAHLRASMIDQKIDLYIIPSTDPHLGEYVPDHWRIIEWLTGFTGSSATVIVTSTFAGLWTDSRYYLQAESQLRNSGFVLMNSPSSHLRDFTDWLTESVKPESNIGFDGRTISISLFRKFEKELKEKSVSFAIDCDLISEVWIDRPSMPISVAFDHTIEFCGRSREDKIGEVRNLMKNQNADYHLITAPDDIMWLLNIRGNDLTYSPLLTCLALVNQYQIILFADERQVPLRLAMEFDKLNIVMLPYEEIGGMLSALSYHSSILLSPTTTSVFLYNSIRKRSKIIECISIPTRLKSVKNSIEAANIRNVMVKDGVALTKFFYWLEQGIGSKQITELTVSEKLNQLRSEQANYLGPSFSTIAAWNEHGSLPHYSATIASDALIEADGILLVDSGGQYLDGTTDITRTIVIGQSTEQQKRDFTNVLKGTINLAMAKFPHGTKGYQLDILARKALWDQGLNYGHGTGHGVGFCLNVHEGPQNISPGSGAGKDAVIEAGMLISDEPAVYREGEYGIRIENLILCIEDEKTEFGKFLKFDTVSLCYIDKSLIDKSLLNKKEAEWLNSYHALVFEKLSPHLTEAENIWLKGKTTTLNYRKNH
jgi:Xaa-Pro aminopeptidase